MRFPALRLPAWRPSVDWLEGLITRTTLLYILYTAILFGVFLVANFPYGVLVQRTLNALEVPGLRLDIGGARFAWWRGIEVENVRLASLDPNQAEYLHTAGLFVRPGLDGLWRGRPRSIHVGGPLYGGELDASFSSGEVNRATVTIEGVQLQHYPLLSTLLEGGQIAGRLNGAGTVEAQNGDGSEELRAAGELTLTQASLTDAKWQQFPVPALHFDSATLKFSLQGNRLDIQELDAVGPELKLSATGQVALRPNIADSVLNLKVSITPGAESPEEIKALLQILPPVPKGAKADAPRVLSGTLAKPRLR
jgi:type II secretion system protein N